MDVHQIRRERLRELVREISAAELARRSGVDATLISRYLYEAHKAGAKNLGESNARKLERAANKLPGWLDKQHSTEGLPFRPVAHPMSQVAGQHAPQSQVEVAVRFRGRPTLEGGIELELLESGGVVPAPFVGPEAFAVRIAGDALDPFAMSGDLLVCDPGQAVRGDERVLIRLRDGGAVLCHLIARKEDTVTTQGIVTRVRATIPAADIEQIAPVVMVVSGSRWQPR